MAKRSRRPTRGEPVAPAAAAPQPVATTKPATSPAATTTTARQTRVRSRRTREKTFFERYRPLIIGGAAVVGLLFVVWIFFQSSARAGYSCDTLLQPGPVESVTPRPTDANPDAEPQRVTDAIGFTVRVAGRIGFACGFRVTGSLGIADRVGLAVRLTVARTDSGS